MLIFQTKINNYLKEKSFIINDRGNFLKIRQPKLNELAPLYYLLLNNLKKSKKVSKQM